ncbi:sulfatase [bacterium]|nr:sulfatase [bacterium]
MPAPFGARPGARIRVFFALAVSIAFIAIVAATAPGCTDSSSGDDGDDDAPATPAPTDDDRDTPPDPRPDIVVIMTDDQELESYDQLRGNGLTPNLERFIADRGVNFLNSFVTNAICCPARATFLTGQYSHNHGVLNNNRPRGGVNKFEDEVTLATILQDGGYRTGLVGKYLNGYGASTSATYVPPGWDDWQVLIDPSTYLVYNYKLNDNGRVVYYGDAPEDYQTDVLAERAVDFIRESALARPGQPMFLWVSVTAPHNEFLDDWWDDERNTMHDVYALSIRPAPRHTGVLNLEPAWPPSVSEEDMSDKPFPIRFWPKLSDEDRASVARAFNDRQEALLSVDDLIGAVGSALKEYGRLENTLFIFASDNGFQFGKHRVPQKGAPYEPSIRVPLAIRPPGGVEEMEREEIVLNNDLAPTILEYAGLEDPIDMDGRSLAPLLGAGDAEWTRRRLLVEHWAINDPFGDLATHAGVREFPRTGLPAGALYVETVTPWFQTQYEFYDLDVDPYQIESLHKDMSAGRVAQRTLFSDILERLRHCAGRFCRYDEDDPLED